jgi:hypothetical protein
VFWGGLSGHLDDGRHNRRRLSGSRALSNRLSVTGNDNDFVTMFFLLIPALTALISLCLSWCISDLHFAVSWMFYIGLAVVSASLLFFSLKSWGESARQ